MNSSDFKAHCEGMMSGFKAMSDQAIANVRKTYSNSSKEDLEKFEEALKSSNVQEKVVDIFEKIRESNKPKND